MGRSGSAIEQLSSGGLPPARSEPTARLHASENRRQYALPPTFWPVYPKASGFVPTDLSRFDSTVLGIVPTAHVDQPWFSNHGSAFGGDVTPDVPGIVAAPPVRVPLLCPLTKEPFQLPAGCQQNEDLVKAEQATGHLGAYHAPRTPEHVLLTHVSLLLVRFSSQPFLEDRRAAPPDARNRIRAVDIPSE